MTVSPTARRDDRRADPADGNRYTRAEFVEYYGGAEEWEAASPAGPDVVEATVNLFGTIIKVKHLVKEAKRSLGKLPAEEGNRELKNGERTLQAQAVLLDQLHLRQRHELLDELERVKVQQSGQRLLLTELIAGHRKDADGIQALAAAEGWDESMFSVRILLSSLPRASSVCFCCCFCCAPSRDAVRDGSFSSCWRSTPSRPMRW